MFEDLMLNIRVNSDGVRDGINDTGKAIKELKNSMNGLNDIISSAKIYMLSDALAGMVKSTLDMTETVNLFNVSMGQTAVATNEALTELSAITGLDLTNLQNATGSYALLARSMGLTSEQAQTLALNTSKLAIDLSSLTNVPIQRVMDDLRSGLLGQSETVYKYGIDVTEAGLEAERMAQGIEKSVRNMSQGEKMALRYSVMIRNSGIAQGDFANTINTGANQLRILHERFVTLGRSIGSIFIPMITAVLPYLNAFISILIDVANAIAKFFGFEAPSVENVTNSATTGIGEVQDGLDDTTASAGKTNKALKEMKNNLMGFDEINILPKDSAPSDTGGGGGTGGGIGGGGIADIKLPSMGDFYKNVKSVSDDIKKALLDAFTIHDGNPFNNLLMSLQYLYKSAMPLIDTLSDAFKWLWDNVLVPLGNWTISDLLPAFFKLLGDVLTLLNSVLKALKPLWDWFWNAVVKPLGIAVGDALVKSLLALGDALLVLSDWIDNNQTAFQMMTAVLIGFFVALNVLKLLEFTVVAGECTVAIKALSKGMFSLGEAMAFAELVKEFGLLKTLKDLYPVAFAVGQVIAGLSLAIGGIIIFFKGLYDVVTETQASIKTFAEVVAGIILVVVGILLLPVETMVAVVAGVVMAIVAIGTYIYKYWDEIKAWTIETWDKITDKLSQVWTDLETGVNDMLTNIKDWFTNRWTDIKNFLFTTIPNIVDSVIKWFDELPKKIGDALGFALGKAVKWGLDTWNYLSTEVPKWINSIGNWFKNLPTNIGNSLTNAYNNVVNWGKNVYNSATTSVSNMVKAVGNFVSNIPTNFRNFINNTVNAVSTWGTNLYNNAVNGVRHMVNGIVNTISNLPQTIYNLGVNVVKGLWNGIQNTIGWLENKVSEFADGFVDGFKRALGIHSPSRIMRDEVGIYLGQGIAVGLEQSGTDVLDSAVGIVDNVKGVFSGVALTPTMGKLSLTDMSEYATTQFMGTLNGNTTLKADDSSLTTAVYDSVYRAMTDAFNQADSDQDIVFNVDGVELGRASISGINKVTKQEGRLGLII